MDVKILGTGCSKCHQLTNKIKKMEGTLPDLEVEYISDIAEIMKYGVMSVPVLVINGEVKAVGRVPTDKELRTLLEVIDD